MVRDALGRPLKVGDVVVLDAPSAPWQVIDIQRVTPNPVNGVPDPRRPAEMDILVQASMRVRAVDERALRELVRVATVDEVKTEAQVEDVDKPGPRLVQPS